ncbi:AAA family ATPase [Marinifilum sp.]|uniref:AAA family ATPase n=1 Tax=Marinifilum sp. TaxID=2033137 RepID=UPI003BAC213A
MHHFLTSIQINKIFHLEDIKIDIDEKEKKHLLITGKNGCGKTSLLNALVNYLQSVRNDKYLGFLKYRKYKDDLMAELGRLGHTPSDELKKSSIIKDLDIIESNIQNHFGKVDLAFNHIHDLASLHHNEEFLFAFYPANRISKVIRQTNPEKPNLNPVEKITDSKQIEFVKFLIDLKVQEALAERNGDIVYANEIKEWFDNFEALLYKVFEDENLKLHFNFKNYVFTIQQNEKEFGFNELSDGYSAIIYIITDLILKMQDPENLTRAYKKQGIVLIDEIETHLHLELQKAIMPMLTRVFPNIQFIVTTHSPFVLNSIDNAVAYDLEKKERLDELHEYSYEALAEGYFDVSTESSFLNNKLERLKELIKKEERDSDEQFELNQIKKEFDEALDNALTPESVKIEYQQIKLNS